MSWEALDLALTLHAAPGLVGEWRGRPLPAGITRLLRVALGQPDSLAEASEVTGQPAARLVDAARFFVEQQLLAREVEHDPWRVLGVHPQGSEIELRANHHLLVRLVHPDRGDDWASAHAERVNRAWRLLRHAEDRAAFVVTPPTAVNAPGDAWVARSVDVPAAAPAADAAPAPAAGRGYRRWATAAIATVIATAALWWAVPSEHDRTAPVPPPPAADWYAAPAPIADASAPEVAVHEVAVPDVASDPAADAVLAPIVPIDTLVSASTAATTAPRPPATAATTALPQRARAAAAIQRRPPPPVVAAPAPAPVVAPEAVAEAAVPEIAAPAAPVARATPTRAPTDAETMALLDTYAARYARGDLGGVLGLYAREVHAETRRIGALANRYAGEFKDAPQRALAFSGVRWQRHDDRITGEARYELRLRKRGALRARVEQGRIEFELVQEGGASRLLRFDTLAEQRS